MMNKQIANRQRRGLRARRARSRLTITAERPRLNVTRSLKHIGGQIITHDGKVVVAISDKHLVSSKSIGVARARETGKLLAEKAIAQKITSVVFDKSHYAYHGRVKAFAEGAREGGLTF